MRRLAGPAVVALLVAGWFVTLRPATLGGPATYVIVSGHSMQPALTPGSLVVGQRRGSYTVGDVIIYRVPKDTPGGGTRVIHRIVGGSADAGYITRGDNRQDRDRWRPRPRDIEGRELVAVPGAGRAMMLLASPLVLGGLVALLACLCCDDALLTRGGRRSRAEVARAPSPVRVPGVRVPPATVLSMPLPAPAGPALFAPLPALAPAPVTASPEPATAQPAGPLTPRSPKPPARRPVRPPGRARTRQRRVLATGGAVAGCVGVGLLVARAGHRR